MNKMFEAYVVQVLYFLKLLKTNHCDMSKRSLMDNSECNTQAYKGLGCAMKIKKNDCLL